MRVWAALAGVCVLAVVGGGCSEDGPSAEELVYVGDVVDALRDDGFDEEQANCFAADLVAAVGYDYLEEEAVSATRLVEFDAGLDVSGTQAEAIVDEIRACDLFDALAEDFVDFDLEGVVIRDEAGTCVAGEFRNDEDRDGLLARMIALDPDDEPRELDQGTLVDIMIDCGIVTDAFLSPLTVPITDEERDCIHEDLRNNHETKGAVASGDEQALAVVFLDAVDDCLSNARAAEVFGAG